MALTITYNQALFKQIQNKPIPNHIAIIMDGNGRWATAKGLTRLDGHRAGVEVVDNILQIIKLLKIKHLTVYAFSTENWKRPKQEVDGLMKLLVEFLIKKLPVLMEEDIRLRILGDKKGLPDRVKQKVNEAEVATENNQSLNFNVAINYGSRAEIIRAVKNFSEDVMLGKLNKEELTDEIFSQYLYTKDQPDPDLLIRSSGEFRLSNFLLWQIAYAEIWMTKVLWPDFKPDHLLEAIYDYQKRERRFGGINTGEKK